MLPRRKSLGTITTDSCWQNLPLMSWQYQIPWKWMVRLSGPVMRLSVRNTWRALLQDRFLGWPKSQWIGIYGKGGWEPTFKGAQVTKMLSQFADLYTSPCYSKCGPGIVNIYITRELVRSEEPWVPSQSHWIRNGTSTSSLGEFYTPTSLRSTASITSVLPSQGILLLLLNSNNINTSPLLPQKISQE